MSDRQERTHFVVPHLPSDEADEWAVLGALVTYPSETVRLLGDGINPGLFPSPACRTVFEAASALLETGAPVNVITVTQKLRESGQLEAVGGAYAVTRLATEFGCTPAVAEYHLGRLRDNAALRLGLETAAWLSEASQTWGTDPSEIVAGMMERVERIHALQDAKGASAVALGALVKPAEQEEENLLGNRFICRAGGLLLVGPTGVGKSSLGMQASVCFALGRPCFGIAPARPLRSLIIQAENDVGDMIEMRDGVFAGLALNMHDRERAGAMIECFHENARSGAEFFTRTVEPLLRLHRPDLVWIDPALSYLGGDASSQQDVGKFLRNWLNPLLKKYRCAAVIVHHTNKPPSGKEKADWSGSDLAYLGSGSAEWANWARAVIAVRSLGENGIFELCLGKRGGRVGWRNEAGEPIYTTLIGHAREPGRIYWRNADESELSASGSGEFKRFTVDHIADLLGKEELRAAPLQRLVCGETGMSRSNFYKLLEEGEKSGRLHKEKVSQLWVVQSVQNRSK